MPNNKKRKRPQPLVPPPKLMSRKVARRVTTQFHKLVRQNAQSDSGCTALECALRDMGVAYQEASQVSTSFHSTSKWVLSYLSRNGWVHGIVVGETTKNNTTTPNTQQDTSQATTEDESNKKKKIRRPTRLLEVGAINSELLDAAAARPSQRLLNVRSIDLHSTDRRIEQADFNQIPLPLERYDVIVCSMVLNCVPTPAARGEMIGRLYHFLTLQGLCFLTLPRTCLNLSPYIDKLRFEALLTQMGLNIVEQKASPKIQFYVCQRNPQRPCWDPQWSQQTTLRQGKKYTNDFAVVITQESYQGATLNVSKKKKKEAQESS